MGHPVSCTLKHVFKYRLLSILFYNCLQLCSPTHVMSTLALSPLPSLSLSLRTYSSLNGACTSFHAPREHWSIGALLIFFCSRIVLQKMYEVLLQRSTGSKEHLTILSLCSLLSCLSLPLIGPRRPVRASDWMLLAPCSSGVQDV